MARLKGLTINIDFWFCHILIFCEVAHSSFILLNSILPVLQTRVSSWLGCTICLHTVISLLWVACFNQMGYRLVVNAESLSQAPHVWAYDQYRIIHCPKSIPEKCSCGNEDGTWIKVCHEHLKCISWASVAKIVCYWISSCLFPYDKCWYIFNSMA